MKRSFVAMFITAWIVVVVFVAAGLVLGANTAANLIKEEAFSVHDINSMILQSDRKSVEIVATQSAQAKIKQYGRQGTATEDLFSIDIAEGCATINNKSQFKIFDLWTYYEKIVLEIPVSWVGNVELNSKSGAISIKESFVWKDVILNSTSGGIYIDKTLTAENINLKATSGVIKAKDELKAGGTIKAQSTSGGIKFNMPIKASEICLTATSGGIAVDKIDTINLEISNTSGTIKLGEIQTDSFNLANTSGNIKVAGITGSGNMKTTSGGINVKLNDAVGKINLESKSGSIKIVVDVSLSFSFSGQCTSGSVRANFLLDGSDTKASATVGSNPTAVITATATSGDIKIYQE